MVNYWGGVGEGVLKFSTVLSCEIGEDEKGIATKSIAKGDQSLRSVYVLLSSASDTVLLGGSVVSRSKFATSHKPNTI